MSGLFIVIIIGIVIVAVLRGFEDLLKDKKREQRRTFYRDDYLKSDDWKRKRWVVLKRDGHRCVYCGGKATQVHHKQYARRNIGREPIEWLVSICKSCHDKQHPG